MPNLEPDALDQVTRRLARLRERQAGSRAERGRQRVDLPHRWLAVHADMAAEKSAQMCAGSVPKLHRTVHG